MAEWLREPAVAGTFYPGDKLELEREMDRCLGSHHEACPARVVMGPHAGTMYSGTIAGAVYARVRVPRRCIVLSPNHSGRGAPAALWPRGSWRTPLGVISVDEQLAQQVAENCIGVEEDRRAHEREHSLEVHLPFLQTRRPDIQIVPLTLAFLPVDSCIELGEAIAKVVAHEPDEVLIVASTDMSHYIPAAEAQRLDHQALEHVVSVDSRGLYETVLRNEISMCGVIPTTVALAAARALGVHRGELIAYGNSGDVSGDFSAVVGYASVKLSS